LKPQRSGAKETVWTTAFVDKREKYYYIDESKYPVNPWSTVEVAIRALPQERFAFCRVSTAGRIALPLRSAISEL